MEKVNYYLKLSKREKIKTRHEWHFTEDEKDHFRIAFDAKGITKGIDQFIDRAEQACYGEMLLREQPAPGKIDRKALKVLRDLKDALSTVEMMWRGDLRLTRYLRIPTKEDNQNKETVAFNRELINRSLAVVLPLRDLIQTIQARPKVKQDRRGTPGNVTELEKHVRKIFNETIGPRTKVVISDILKIARGAVNRPHSDITRTLKTLR